MGNILRKAISASDGWVEVPNFNKGVNGGESIIYITHSKQLPEDVEYGFPLIQGMGADRTNDLEALADDLIYIKVLKGSAELFYKEV